MIGAAERRIEIIKLLCRRRKEKVKNIASEFGVSERTIRRDIETLSLIYPIYTQSGRESGGVYILDTYSFEKMYMSSGQIELLEKVLAVCEKNNLISKTDIEGFVKIIDEYKMPTAFSKNIGEKQ